MGGFDTRLTRLEESRTGGAPCCSRVIGMDQYDGPAAAEAGPATCPHGREWRTIRVVYTDDARPNDE